MPSPPKKATGASLWRHVGPPNGSRATLRAALTCMRAERRAACRREAASQRLPICERREAVRLAMKEEPQLRARDSAARRRQLEVGPRWPPTYHLPYDGTLG